MYVREGVSEKDGSPIAKLELDGYYCCEKVISQVYFMADSILGILVNSEEFRLLNTERFKQGDVSYFTKGKRLGVDIIEGRSFK